jgi:hypothetical protein
MIHEVLKLSHSLSRDEYVFSRAVIDVIATDRIDVDEANFWSRAWRPAGLARCTRSVRACGRRVPAAQSGIRERR